MEKKNSNRHAFRVDEMINAACVSGEPSKAQYERTGQARKNQYQIFSQILACLAILVCLTAFMHGAAKAEQGKTTLLPADYVPMMESDIEYTLPELTHYTIYEDKLLNVYTGPGFTYNRINKASTRLSTSIWVFAQYEDWLLIQYPIKSEDRIGYINVNEIRFRYTVPILPNEDVQALTASSCPILNNPLNEKSAFEYLPKNTSVQVLCKYQGYAYVEAIISDMPTRGFVYIGDLKIAKE